MKKHLKRLKQFLRTTWYRWRGRCIQCGGTAVPPSTWKLPNAHLYEIAGGFAGLCRTCAKRNLHASNYGMR